MDIHTNRRALLGAMALAPIATAAIAVPALSTQYSDAFDVALAAYRRADAEVARYEKDDLKPAVTRFDAWRSRYSVNGDLDDHSGAREELIKESALTKLEA